MVIEPPPGELGTDVIFPNEGEGAGDSLSWENVGKNAGGGGW